MRRLVDTQLTDEECEALFAEFMMDGMFGGCRCSALASCPICDDDKLDAWLRKRRMASLGLRVIQGGQQCRRI